MRLTSETGALRSVLVHRPGGEFRRVTPDIMNDCLIDDLVDPDRAANEHDGLTNFFSRCGITYHDTQHLLHDVLEGSNRTDAMKMILASNDDLRHLTCWESLDSKQIVEWLVTGIHPDNGHTHLPAVNLTFSRDAAAMVGNTVYVLNPKGRVRRLEAGIMEAIVGFHSLFGNMEKVSYLGKFPNIEGGDILVISEDLVVVGTGHRTSSDAVVAFAKDLLQRGVKTVLVVDVRNSRAQMHLDTVFTVISSNEVLVFPPAIAPDSGYQVRKYELVSGTFAFTKKYSSLLDALANQGHIFTPIFCGGEDPITQAREQWWDGANSVALAPGVIVLYDRCTATIAELEKHDYHAIPIGEADQLPTEKTVLLMESNELPKARGGGHCMTMPIHRE